MSVALLIFSLGEVEGVLRNIRSLREVVDEIVIVDSSPPVDYEALQSHTSRYSAKVYRALPLGFPEPLRPFGLSKVESDYTLILDADEEASDGLRSDLRGLHEYEAYVLPRFEEGLKSYTYHLRLLRPSAVRYHHRSFDFPDVLGQVGRLDKSHRIVHHANYSDYLIEKARAQRYFTIENVERPFNRQYGHSCATWSLGRVSERLHSTAAIRSARGGFSLGCPTLRGTSCMPLLSKSNVTEASSATSDLTILRTLTNSLARSDGMLAESMFTRTCCGTVSATENRRTLCQ